MKIILILTAVLLLFASTIIAAAKIMNPAANRDVEFPWDFPLFAILLVAAFVIINNQENIIQQIKVNKK